MANTNNHFVVFVNAFSTRIVVSAFNPSVGAFAQVVLVTQSVFEPVVLAFVVVVTKASAEGVVTEVVFTSQVVVAVSLVLFFVTKANFEGVVLVAD